MTHLGNVGEPLNYRETQVTNLLMGGSTIADVAARLGIAKATVSDYIYRARHKAGAATNYQLFAQLGRDA